ncbi:DUF998 domain-containing protein [Streptomyces tendae]|uniref:DUF998 domain-containing protein n=1 Tax=Streptomyces tendae TaxID=1932 RepID=A0ABX5ZUH0_STRTE|nr:DUF998 domain-containing protein [Streptomyces tendae]QER87865.1 DUF998 domain-containing protein [Streptomyces tendae]
MLLVPRWVLLSSGFAPLLLIAGWVIAAVLEGSAYDPVTQTISVLAAYGASGSWVMTGAFIALGVCHLLTAWGLRAAAAAGRAALAGGEWPRWPSPWAPPSSGGSLGHGSVAAVGFVLLALWPVLAADGRRTAPWALRPTPSLAATALMVAGAAWFLIEMHRHGMAGVAERVVTAVQSLWPFVVVTSCLRHRTDRERSTA